MVLGPPLSTDQKVDLVGAFAKVLLSGEGWTPEAPNRVGFAPYAPGENGSNFVTVPGPTSMFLLPMPAAIADEIK